LFQQDERSIARGSLISVVGPWVPTVEVKAMPAEASKRLVREYIEICDNGDTRELPNSWTSDIIHHTRALKQNSEEVKAVLGDFKVAFPDLHSQIDDIFRGRRPRGDPPGGRRNAFGFLSRPPTDGKEDQLRGHGHREDRGGQDRPALGVTDKCAMMAQIGMLPEPLLQAMT
jgi:hypothetical protein